jgi:ATP-dependent RNA helicase DeaD
MTEVETVAPGAEFTALGLDPRLAAGVTYAQPSPIQREAIPGVLTGRDLVGLAGTGTGKTAAFALPLLHRIAAIENREGVAALVLVPTRELAVQVAKAVTTYGKALGLGAIAVYGGTGYADQVRAIRRGVAVVVATPGRALDLVKQGSFPLGTISTVVLDEADEMLDMGFAEDIDALLAETPATRQTLLFSATMPPRIEEMARRHLRDPIRVKVAREVVEPGDVARVRQTAYLVRRENKAAALARILEVERPTSALVFCRTRTDADALTELLAGRGFKPLALHGGLSQDQRDRVMFRFRSGAADLLVATDIAARGLDIAQLSHVVNMEPPAQADDYVHRIGRVGRAGRAGVAITLVSPQEQRDLYPIERATGQRLEFAPVPTAKDLRAARLNRTRDRLRDALTQPVTDDVAAMVAELAKEIPLADIARVAINLLGGAGRPEDEVDIPPVTRDVRPAARPRGGPDERRRAGSRPANRGMAKVFFGIGRDARVTPRDLVGAISNEAGIPVKDLGAIDVTDRFALVEVPHEVADYVVEAMQGARIRGRKVNVRPDRAPRGGY